MFPVYVVSLRLTVGAVRAADIGALIPIYPEPPQILIDGLLVAPFGPGAVSVLDPQYERTAILTRE